MHSTEPFVLLGYRHLAPFDRPAWMSKDALPSILISASHCLSPDNEQASCFVVADPSALSDVAPPGSRVLAIALSASDCETLRSDIDPGFDECDRVLLTALEKGDDIRGTTIGYDVLGYDNGQIHSWLCNGLEVDMYKRFGVLVGSTGLFPDLRQARIVSTYATGIAEETDAAVWLPCALLDVG